MRTFWDILAHIDRQRMSKGDRERERERESVILSSVRWQLFCSVYRKNERQREGEGERERERERERKGDPKFAIWRGPE